MHRRGGADGVAIVELDRPERRHAMDTGLLRALIATLEALSADGGVRAVVITGAGGCFSSGADVSEELDHAGAVGRMRLFARLYELSAAFPKPTVAAIDGWCIGGGAELAACCDLRAGTPGCGIRFPGAAFGVPVGAARLPLLIGLSHAKDLLMTARTVRGDEAFRMGLLNRLAEPADLLATACDLAGAMAANKGAVTQKHALEDAMGLAARRATEHRGMLRWQDEAESLMGGPVAGATGDSTG